MKIDLDKIKKSNEDKKVFLEFIGDIHDLNKIFKEGEKNSLFKYLIEKNDDYIHHNKICAILVKENKELISYINFSKIQSLSVAIEINKVNSEFSRENFENKLNINLLHTLSKYYLEHVDLLKHEIIDWFKKQDVKKLNVTHIGILKKNLECINKNSQDKELLDCVNEYWQTIKNSKQYYEIILKNYPETAIHEKNMVDYFHKKYSYYIDDILSNTDYENFISLGLKHKIFKIKHQENGMMNILSKEQYDKCQKNIGDFPFVINLKDKKMLDNWMINDTPYYAQRSKFIKFLSQQLSKEMQNHIKIEVKDVAKLKLSFNLNKDDILNYLKIDKENRYTPQLMKHFIHNYSFEHDIEKYQFLNEIVKQDIKIIEACECLFTKDLLNSNLGDFLGFHPKDKRGKKTVGTYFYELINKKTVDMNKKSFLENLIVINSMDVENEHKITKKPKI